MGFLEEQTKFSIEDELKLDEYFIERNNVLESLTIINSYFAEHLRKELTPIYHEALLNKIMSEEGSPKPTGSIFYEKLIQFNNASNDVKKEKSPFYKSLIEIGNRVYSSCSVLKF